MECRRVLKRLRQPVQLMKTSPRAHPSSVGTHVTFFWRIICMRIVTRPDFDGVVCAVLLSETNPITEPINWVEPDDMQKNEVEVRTGDIIANLPYHKNCSLWFDHHYTNQIKEKFEGAFRIAPSAAGVVFDYYLSRGHVFSRDYTRLIAETDKIDSANLSLEEVLHPEEHPFVILSMTVSNRRTSDKPYWNNLVELLGKHDIHAVLREADVKDKCQTAVARNKSYKIYLTDNTRMIGHISLTDFRGFSETPFGNRYLVYALFPDAVVNVQIRLAPEKKEKVIIGVGHSIFNPHCRVNVGKMLSAFGGGGHRGAGSCTVPFTQAEECLQAIIDILSKNESNEQ